MATSEHKLVNPPKKARTRELWLQHAAGFILFEDVRRDAIERIDPKLKGKARAAALKAIDDTMYGLMQVIEDVSGGLSNSKYTVYIDFIARLESRDKSGTPYEINLRDGDGMCMGYHGWLQGDFGKAPIATRRPDKK